MKRYLLIISIAMMAAACSQSPKEPTREELSAAIDSIESPIMAAAQIETVDSAKGNNLIELYLQFANTYPDDSLAPAYLHRAAQVANGLDRIDDMVIFYNRVIDNYPEYGKLDECYYEKGIALDNADRKKEAREAYQEFLDAYPDHFLADDIRKAIPLLDMSDELLIKFLEGANS